MAKSALKVVRGNIPQPPRGLDVHGTELWNSIQTEYGIRDCGGIELLFQICSAADRAASLKQRIADDGEIITDLKTGNLKDHPALKHGLSATGRSSSAGFRSSGSPPSPRRRARARRAWAASACWEAGAMPTTRTPIRRDQQSGQFTEKAVDLFAKLIKIECTCEPRDWGGEYWKHTSCEGCEKWSSLESKLLHEFDGLMPWECPPVVEDPDAANPYPPWTNAYNHWKPNRGAQARWLALDEALKERRNVSRRR